MNIKQRDVIEDMRSYGDCFYNTIFADPPYNLGSKIAIGEDGRPQFTRISDFMGKWAFNQWEEFFAEAYRILKHGGYCVLFGIDRQAMLLEYYATKAGFEISQCLYWIFASSFPKATDLSLSFDKKACRDVLKTKLGRNPTKEEFKREWTRCWTSRAE